MAIKKTTTAKSTPVKKASTSMSISIAPKAEMKKWEIESALNTLKRADEIRKDSRLMADVKKAANEMQNIVNNAIKK